MESSVRSSLGCILGVLSIKSAEVRVMCERLQEKETEG